MGDGRSGCLHGLCRHCHRPELSQLSEVLSSGCKQELVAGAARSSQPKTTQPEDALEVGEQHLRLLASMAGGAASAGSDNIDQVGNYGDLAGGLGRGGAD